MALFNYATKEITLKIVYYGPGLSGKTTNLQYLHASMDPESKGKLLSLSTESDRTLFFDFLPVELGKIREFSIRFQLYTVPGQVRYNATRKIVLKGADAVIFVADSQIDMKEQNLESFENMMDNLRSNNIDPDDIPIVLQYNKRDLKNILSIDELEKDLNPGKKYHYLEASALNGTGVEDMYKLTTKLLLKNISSKHKIEIQPVHETKDLSPDAFAEQETEVTGLKQPSGTGVYNERGAREYNLQEFSQSDFDSPLEKTALPDTKPKSTEDDIFRSPSAAAKTTHHDPLSVSLRDKDTAKLPPEKMRKETIQQDDYTLRKSDVSDKKPEMVIKEIREVPAIPLDKINAIAGELVKISGTLSSMKDSVSALNAAVSVLAKEIKEVREVRREQKETNALLRNIHSIFEKLQTKKPWFRF